MMWRAVLFLLFWPSLVWAQQGVLQSGVVTPGHAPVWVLNNTIGDGGSATNGKLSELGITNTGTPLCINDAPITAPGGYHQLCLGANSLGGGLLSYNAYKTSPLPLKCNINGVVSDCLGGASGPPIGYCTLGGDPTGVSDNAAAWTAQITQVSSIGGCLMRITAGTWKINSNVAVPNNIMIDMMPGAQMTGSGALMNLADSTEFNQNQNQVGSYLFRTMTAPGTTTGGSNGVGGHTADQSNIGLFAVNNPSNSVTSYEKNLALGIGYLNDLSPGGCNYTNASPCRDFDGYASYLVGQAATVAAGQHLRAFGLYSAVSNEANVSMNAWGVRVEIFNNSGLSVQKFGYQNNAASGHQATEYGIGITSAGTTSPTAAISIDSIGENRAAPAFWDGLVMDAQGVQNNVLALYYTPGNGDASRLAALDTFGNWSMQTLSLLTGPGVSTLVGPVLRPTLFNPHEWDLQETLPGDTTFFNVINPDMTSGSVAALQAADSPRSNQVHYVRLFDAANANEAGIVVGPSDVFFAISAPQIIFTASAVTLSSGTLFSPNLPTSCTVSGTLWNSSGTVKVC